MADSLLSSIATFHTTKIIVTDPTKFSFTGPILEAMLGCISASSNVLQRYMKRPSVGPRELTPAMIRSIEEADKPAKRGKKPETQKEGPAQPKKQKKPARRLILQSSSDSGSKYVPPKHKNDPSLESERESSDEEASGRGDTPPRSPTPEILVRSNPPSPPPVTIPFSIPPISPITTSQTFTIIPISTPIFTDTTTTTTTTKPHFTVPNPPVTEPPVTTEPPPTSKPLSPTQSTETTPILGGEDSKFDSMYFSPYRVQSDDDDDEPVTKRHLKAVNEKLDQLLSSSSSGAYSEAALKALFSSVDTEHSATLSAAAKVIEASTSQCQQASLAVDASTKECKEATAKVDKLVSKAHLLLDSLQAAAAKNAQTVNASVENLQRSLQS
ncbi:gibberellin-regulated protein 14-like [Lactuca sativa]|uniref:gibberellin-regulated protein 14-like n=1 Tax=Lactuca sativa TaxID=4236 RepID=UPI0022AF10FE|nr:gibberellin-regulated protein 14-like [Lactuca sativa]